MPRISQKAYVQRDLERAVEYLCWELLLNSDSEHESDIESDIENLIDIHTIISSERYLSRPGGTGRHDSNNLDELIYQSPEATFLALFRVHREPFWQLVELLKIAGGEGYWDRRVGSRGRPPRPVYQQVAVALYMFGGKQDGDEQNRIALDIGKGTLTLYLWRVLDLLAGRLLPEHVCWPTVDQRAQVPPKSEIFRQCIGFLDGSTIILRDKPKVDPEAYVSRNRNYGFNLQAICDWEGKFTWAAMGHTAYVNDARAFKSTDLYRNRDQASYFNAGEYVLADNGYTLEEYFITPYKEPASREPRNSAFNRELSTLRTKIEHAYGVLKARWPSLNDIPIRIDENQTEGHNRVMNWTMACIVLHNMLATLGDDEAWLQEGIEAVIQRERNNQELMREAVGEGTIAGRARRDSLRDLVPEVQAREH